MADLVYQRIKEKFENGTFTNGNDCQLTRYYFEYKTIRDFPISERTPDVCASLMDYSRCKLSDVPEISRTREFYIATFTNNDVYNYIKTHIKDFDRQFFKDLITTNKYATYFDRNCFTIMPIEYIDEEMCSLVFMHNTDWAADKWFYDVYERKPEALTADLFKLAAKLYSRLDGHKNRILDITPIEYKDEEYYLEMCQSSVTSSDKNFTLMDTISSQILTTDFLLKLLYLNPESISIFNEKALETTANENGLKMWQIALFMNGHLIRNIPFNEERICFFKNHYAKDSGEYQISFKDKYRVYRKSKENAEEMKGANMRTMDNSLASASRVLLGAVSYAANGENPTQAIDDEIARGDDTKSILLPINYRGIIPYDLRKKYDSEEYLELVYKALGVEILNDYDNLFYQVNIPNTWTIIRDGYFNYVYDENEILVIKYFYDSKFYDRDAYVREVNIPDNKLFGSDNLSTSLNSKNITI